MTSDNNKIVVPIAVIGVSTILQAMTNIRQTVNINELEKEIELLKEYKEQVEESANFDSTEYMVLQVNDNYYILEGNNIYVNTDDYVTFIDIYNNTITVPASNIEYKGLYESISNARKAIDDGFVLIEPVYPHVDGEWENMDPIKLDR